jgi:glycosyltransferase involved in cell wall biosynthesis
MEQSMSGKKILLVTSWVYPHIGGVSSHLQLLARKLGISDNEVVSFKDIIEVQSRGLKRFETAFLRHSRRILKLDNISLFAMTLSDIIAAKDCDVVHCHDAMATWAAIRARKRSGRNFSIVSTVHGPVSRHMIEEGYAPDSADVKKAIKCEIQAWAGADAIIAVDTLQGKIVESQGADPKKITVIPNAVDIDELERLADAVPVTAYGGRPWIFVPRRLSPKNGIEHIIRAMKLIECSPKPLLLLAGDGLERKRLEDLVIELDLGRDVVFLGNLGHAIMIPLMKSSAVVVIPSVPVHGIEEATSIAAIEAMALAKPVVASAIGGLKELLVNGKNGILVPPAYPQSLAEAVSDLLADESKRVKIGSSARQTVIASFSDSHWIKRLLNIYSRLFHK